MSAAAVMALRSLDEDAFCALTEPDAVLPLGVDRNDVWEEAERRDAEWEEPADFDMDAAVNALLASGPSEPPTTIPARIR